MNLLFLAFRRRRRLLGVKYKYLMLFRLYPDDEVTFVVA